MPEKKKLVKTGREILKELTGGRAIVFRVSPLDDQYLILPEGLDALEKMLKEELEGGCLLTSNKPGELAKTIVSSVFTRFKKKGKFLNSLGLDRT